MLHRPVSIMNNTRGLKFGSSKKRHYTICVANKKDTDETASMCSLISVFVVCICNVQSDGCLCCSNDIRPIFSCPGSLILHTARTAYLSHVMRKPTFYICENKDADQLRGNREADQRLCFRYIDRTISLLSKSEISSL